MWYTFICIELCFKGSQPLLAKSIKRTSLLAYIWRLKSIGMLVFMLTVHQLCDVKQA